MILRLRAAGLTIEMVGANFIRRRIAPLQHRGGRLALAYVNFADIIQMWTGYNSNLTMMGHAAIC